MIALSFGVGLLASAASAQVVIWSQGFNSDSVDSYTQDRNSFGLRFGLSVPGVITGGDIVGTEGDGFVALNANLPANGVAEVFGGMDVDLGTVTAAGVTYTFSGNFSWRYASVLGTQKDIRILASQTGFIVGEGNASDSDLYFDFYMDETVWSTHSFSFTTVRADVGKPVRLRIRLVDDNASAGLTQLLADDWKVTVRN